MKNHGVSRTAADFSELQLSYFNYIKGYELEGLDGDETAVTSDEGYLDVGGNLEFSMKTMAQWKTFTKESSLPYSTVVSNQNASISPYMSAYHDGAQLRNLRRLDIENDPASVKQAIMDYGAVYISYYHDKNYYNLNKWSLYYNPNAVGTNHDVVIVGWDDSIPASNFKNRPPGNGAWLVRNSWSTDDSVGSEYTYFYMSYYDATLDSTAYSLDFEKGSQSDIIYQHDGSTTSGYLPVTKVANVFKTKGRENATSERLDSVMLPFMGTNINYKVEVYTGLTGSSPTSGYLNSSATTTGWTGNSGIYTIDLKNPVYLYPGEKFSVVVTALSGTPYFEIESSENYTYRENGTTKNWFRTTAHIDSGESFYYSNSQWNDAVGYSSQGYGNICLKAITTKSSVAKYKINYNLNGGTNSTSNPSGFLSSQSGSFTLKNPTRSGYHFRGWYTDSGFTQKVTTINYDNKSSKTLYARWCSNSNSNKTSITKKATMSANGTYKTVCSNCGLVKGTYTSYKASSVSLSATKLLRNGENRSPYPIIKTSNGTKLTYGTDYTYSYGSSSRKGVGRYSVTITFKNKYSGTKKMWFTIVPRAPGYASAKLYGYDDVKFSWEGSTGASGYFVYYKRASSSSWTYWGRTTSRSVKIANFTDNIKLNFKVVPYYYYNGTRYTSTQYTTATATTLKQLNQPSMYTKSDGKVSLTWQSIPGASGYQVYWSKSKSGTYKKLCDYSNKYSGVTFTVGKGVTYWYKTRAYKTVDGVKIYGPFSTPKSYKR
ncbi:MAG: lectin like domain-containing protein [Eubacterium sp.]|nr:lectin like domain-containing protein [Eubacterium sp.]